MAVPFCNVLSVNGSIFVNYRIIFMKNQVVIKIVLKYIKIILT